MKSRILPQLDKPLDRKVAAAGSRSTRSQLLAQRIATLHHQYGNRAVQRLLRPLAATVVQRVGGEKIGFVYGQEKDEPHKTGRRLLKNTWRDVRREQHDLKVGPEVLAPQGFSKFYAAILAGNDRQNHRRQLEAAPAFQNGRLILRDDKILSAGAHVPLVGLTLSTNGRPALRPGVPGRQPTADNPPRGGWETVTEFSQSELR